MNLKDKLKNAADKAVGDVKDAADKVVGDVKDAADKVVGDVVDTVTDAGKDILSTIEEKLLDMDVLKNLAAIVSGTGPASVAQIALQLGSMNENYDRFLDVLSKDCWRGQKKGEEQWIERKVGSWWKTMKGRKYLFNPEDTAKVTTNTATEMKFFFKADDGASVKNKPISIIKEDGEWKVKSITP